MTCGLLVCFASKSLEPATSLGVLLPHGYQYERRPGEDFLRPKGFVGPSLNSRYEGR